jgi:hypothetical protein
LPQNQPHYYEISCIDEADDESTAATNGLVTGTATNDLANVTTTNTNTTACHSVTVQCIHPQFQGYVPHHRYHACFLEILTLSSHLSSDFQCRTFKDSQLYHHYVAPLMFKFIFDPIYMRVSCILRWNGL